MGLGSKLGQLNAANNSATANAKAPLAESGFNGQNINTLPVLPPMTPEEQQRVKDVTLESRNYVHNDGNNITGLVKPQIPQSGDQLVGGLIVEKMWRIVNLKNLFAFFTQDQLQTLVDRACRHDYRSLMIMWDLPTLDMATDIAVLGLYDCVIIVDDSGSMTKEESEGLTRFQILKEAVKTVGFWGTLMDPDGVVLRFLNSQKEGNGLSSCSQIEDLFKGVQVNPYNGTPIGEKMRSVYNTIVKPLLTTNNLNRPILIINMTDGEPSNKQLVIDVISECISECSRTKYGSNAVAFSFGQIGTSPEATEYLQTLDEHPVIGKYVDCTSEYETERKQCGAGFTVSAWIMKLMVGAIDPSYDESDEKPQPVQTQSNRMYSFSQSYQPQQAYPQQASQLQPSAPAPSALNQQYFARDPPSYDEATRPKK